VHTEVDGSERAITFIDTPGHEAFTAMRARGSQSSDIAVLVVAADDGVMPQTVEALNHARAAEVPIVVAVNKIDKPEADPTKVRGQLTEYGLVPEEYGGDTMFVDVSAKSELNLDKLLEAIVLTADASLDLRANPDQDAQGLVVEAHLDRGRGPVATVLVQRGTLRVGDSIVAGPAHGRVRALLDENAEPMEEAFPAQPAMVLGLSAVPGAGQNFLVVEDDRMARQIAEKRESRERAAMQAQRRVRRTLEDFMASMESGESQELNLILKGDVSGRSRPSRTRWPRSTSATRCRCASSTAVSVRSPRPTSTWPPPPTRSSSASTSAAGQGDEMATRRRRDPLLLGHLPGDRGDRGRAQGHAQARVRGVDPRPGRDPAIFRSSKIGNIAGCMVTSGVIRRNAKVRLIRDGAVVADNLDLASLKREKDDASEVREGFECGLVLRNFHDIKEGDVVDAFEMREIPRA
jgi:translation initiation factor IF-2